MRTKAQIESDWTISSAKNLNKLQTIYTKNDQLYYTIYLVPCERCCYIALWGGGGHNLCMAFVLCHQLRQMLVINSENTALVNIFLSIALSSIPNIGYVLNSMSSHPNDRICWLPVTSKMTYMTVGECSTRWTRPPSYQIFTVLWLMCETVAV